MQVTSERVTVSRHSPPDHLLHTRSTRMRETGLRPDIVEAIIDHHDSGIIGSYGSYSRHPGMKGAIIRQEQ